METMTRMQLFSEHTIVTGRFGNLLETCLHCYHSVETRVKTGFLQVSGILYSSTTWWGTKEKTQAVPAACRVQWHEVEFSDMKVNKYVTE